MVSQKSSPSIKQLMSLICRPTQPDHSVIQQLVDQRHQLSLADLSCAIRIATNLSLSDSTNSLTEEFVYRASLETPLSQLCSVLFYLTQFNLTNINRDDSVQRLVQITVEKFLMSSSVTAELLDCAILASTVKFLHDCVKEESVLFQIERKSAVHFNNQSSPLHFRSISLLFSGFINHSIRQLKQLQLQQNETSTLPFQAHHQNICPSNHALFRSGFVEVLLGSSSRALRLQGVSVKPVDIAQFLITLSNAIRYHWPSIKLLLPPKLIPLLLYRCKGFNLESNNLSLMFESLVKCHVTARDYYDSDLHALIGKDNNGFTNLLRHLYKHDFVASLSTLTSTNCCQMIQALYLGEKRNAFPWNNKDHIPTQISKIENNEAENEFGKFQNHKTDIPSSWLLTPIEDAWIESLLYHQWLNSFKINEKNRSSPSIDATLKAWNNIKRLCGTRFPLRSQQAIMVYWTNQLKLLFSHARRITSNEATQRLRSAILLLECFLKLRLYPSITLMHKILPILHINDNRTQEEEDMTDLLPLTVTATFNDLSRLLYILAEYGLHDEVDRLDIFPLLGEVHIDSVLAAILFDLIENASLVFHSVGLLCGFNNQCPKTLVPEFLNHVIDYIKNSKEKKKVESHFTFCGRLALQKLSLYTPEYETIDPHSRSSQLLIDSTYPIASIDVFQFDNRLRLMKSESSELVTSKLQSTLATVMSLFGPKEKRITQSLPHDSTDKNTNLLVRDSNYDIPTPWISRLKQQLESNNENNEVQYNELIDGAEVPIVITFSPPSLELRNANIIESLMKRDPVLWQILGDDDFMKEDADQKNSNNNGDNKTSQKMVGSDKRCSTEKITHERNKFINMPIKEKTTLIFPVASTSMCFTNVSFEGNEVKLGHLTDKYPSTHVARVQQLRQLGWNVIVVKENDFVKTENSEEKLCQFLESLVPFKPNKR